MEEESDRFDVLLQDQMNAMDIFTTPGALLSSVYELYNIQAAMERYLRDVKKLYVFDVEFSPATIKPYLNPKKLEKFDVLIKEVGNALRKYKDACVEEETKKGEENGTL